MKAIVVVLGLATLFCLVEIGFGIMCYECNSYYQQDCMDHFDNQTINTVNCTIKLPGADRCRKIIQEVWLGNDWDVRYIRQCATKGDIGDYEGRTCIERAGTYKVKVRYCHCDNQDGCNTASSLTTFSAFILSLAAFFVLKLIR